MAGDQRWGISAAAAPGDVVAIKDGWLPHDADADRWVIASVGEIIGPDRQWLMVVLSGHHSTEADGIAAVATVARLTGFALQGHG